VAQHVAVYEERKARRGALATLFPTMSAAHKAGKEALSRLLEKT